MSTATTLPPAKIPKTSGETIRLTFHIVFIVVFYSLSLLSLASVLRSQYGFPLDDSYIHQTVARNLVEYGKLGFIPGKTSSGATSVLWTVLQAANYKLIGADPIAFNIAFSWLILTAIGILLFALARRDGLSLQVSIAFSVTPALCGNFVWLGLIGMEHLLFVLLVLGSVYCWFDAGPRHRRSAILTGIAAGLVALARPEALLFGPLVAIFTRKASRRRSDTLIMLVLWALLLAVLFAVDLRTSHSLMPATMKGRSWLYFRSSGGLHSLQTTIAFLARWSIKPSMQFSLWYARPIPCLATELFNMLVPCAITLIGAVWTVRRAASRIRFLFLWALIHFVTFLLVFPAQGQGGRYQPLNLLLLFPCLFFGTVRLLEMIGMRERFRFAVAAALLLAGGLLSLRTWRVVTLEGIAHINAAHGQAALWIMHHAAPEAKIAAFDIGDLSYRSQRPVIDLGGLVDPSFLPYLVNKRVPDYVRERSIDYVVLPTDPPLAIDLGYARIEKDMTEVARLCAAHDIWLVASQYTNDADECQSVYRPNALHTF